MAGRAYGNVVAAGRANMASGNMDRRGPSNKNLGPSRVARPNPASDIRSKARSIKGPDKGAGSK